MLCCLCVSVKAETQASDPSSIILARYRAMLVEGEVKDAETVRGHMEALKEDGSWLIIFASSLSVHPRVCRERRALSCLTQ